MHDLLLSIDDSMNMVNFCYCFVAHALLSLVSLTANLTFICAKTTVLADVNPKKEMGNAEKVN